MKTTLPLVEQTALTLKQLGNLLTSGQGTRPNNLTERFTSQQVQVLNSVSIALSHTADELRSIQHGIGEETLEFDAELKRLSTSLNALQARIISSSSSASNITTEQTQEILRSGTRFAHEINALAHQAIGLTRELHVNMTSFQFEEARTENSDTSGSGVRFPNKTSIPSRALKNTSPRKGGAGSTFT